MEALNANRQNGAWMDYGGTFDTLDCDPAALDRELDQLFSTQPPQVDLWNQTTARQDSINDYPYSSTDYATLPNSRLNLVSYSRATLRDLQQKFICLVCGTSVSRKHDCRRHLLLHAGERSMKAFDELHA